MINLTILFLSKAYDFQHSSLASSFFVKGQSNYNSFTVSNSNFNFFAQSMIKVYSLSSRKSMFIYNSKFQHFLRSPIEVHGDDENKIKFICEFWKYC